MPTSYVLRQNEPNPFEGGTFIEFCVPSLCCASLKIINVEGRVIRALLSGLQPAGYHVVAWDGRDEGNHQVNPGVYFYRLEAGEFGQTRKMVLAR